nr:glutamate-5-semialdehyde dehydrogenase [Helicobacter pametensis]
MHSFLETAKKSQQILQKTPHSLKVKILQDMAQAIKSSQSHILQANALDLQNAKDSLSHAMLERLELNPLKIASMAQSIEEIASLPNPLDRILQGWRGDNGLNFQKISVPIGVIGIIYESRPNVTSDSAALCFKSGNACILKGGKEAHHSNWAILKILQEVLKAHQLPKECISMLENTSHEGVLEFIKQDKWVDLLIPRGGEGLIHFVSQNATIPVLKHDKGVCHLYIHHDAPIDQSIAIAINAKTQRPSTCNSIETLLIHRDIAPIILPPLHQAFVQKDTTLKADQSTQEILNLPLEPLYKEDFSKEYGDNTLNIAIVDSLEDAINHINTFGSGHSESIITQEISAAEQFLNEVDASCVYLNASTRFSDGGEFGFGAEIGISTNKLHARGPVGLEGLTTYKYKILGNFQIRG